MLYLYCYFSFTVNTAEVDVFSLMFVLFSVCPFNCLLAGFSKHHGQNSITVSGMENHGPRKKCLDFGCDLASILCNSCQFFCAAV